MTTKNVSRKNQSIAVRKMVTAAMLGAVTAVLTFTPIGMIPLPPPLLHATTVHVPVILAALVEGPLVGLFVGLVFGVCSFINSWSSGAVGLTLFFRNPLISVVPRLIVPLVALGVYALWKKLARPGAVSDKLGAAVASVFGSLTNTVLCLGTLLLIYGFRRRSGGLLYEQRGYVAGSGRGPSQRHWRGNRGGHYRSGGQGGGRGRNAPRPARLISKAQQRKWYHDFYHGRWQYQHQNGAV